MKFVIASEAKQSHRRIIYLFLLLALLFWNGEAFSLTGPNNPSSAVNNNSYGVVAWAGVNSVFTSNDVWSDAAGLANGQSTNYLVATNFGFSLNPCDNISGIEVKVEWSKSGGGAITDDQINLVVGGVIQTGVNRANATALTTADVITTYGTFSDTWGQTLTGADVNQANFGAAIAVKKGGGAASTPRIDHITITVYHSTPLPMTYSSSTVTQVTGVVNPGTANNQVIRVDVATNAGCPPIAASSFTFNVNGTTSLADIANAKLFFTGTNPVFNTTSQLGTTLASIPPGNFTISGFSQNLLSGTNYFWLAVDVVAGAVPGNLVDAECPSLIVDGISQTPTITAPVGNRTIVNPTVYTVGTAQTYTTIQAAYNAIPIAPSNNSIIEVYNDYNSALETFPISFGNKSNVYNIIVRPAPGNSAIVCQGAIGSQGLWNIDGAQNIIIDGRPGGIGVTREFTIRNTQTSSPFGTAFLLRNDAANISFQYVIVEAETVSGLSLDGIVTIGTSTGTTGNDFINFSNCLIRDISVGGSGVAPWTGIYSAGTTGKTNDNISIDNCEFVQGGLNAINIFSNSGTTDITNNQIYFPSGSGGITSAGVEFINISSGANHTVSGNFIGGTAANCGGAQFTIPSGTGIVAGIFVSAAGDNIIESNTISNLKYTTTYSLTASPLVGISVGGSGKFTIGSSGKGNTIGNMAANGSFVLTHNGTSGSGMDGILNSGTGTVNASYNSIGGVTVNGSYAGANSSLLNNTSGAGTITCDNNTIGGTVAGSILISSNAQLYVVSNSSTGGLTFTNNTVRNITHNAATRGFGGLYNSAGPLTCTGNTFQNISSASDCSVGGAMFVIDHQPSAAATADVSNNLIQDVSMTYSLTTTGKFYGISINQPASNATCNNNTIGSAVNNNLLVAANTSAYAIFHSNTGTLTCDNNTIQEFSLTNGGTTTSFSGISNESGAGTITARSNTIKNIDVVSTYPSGSIALRGINNLSDASGNLISKNSVSNLNLSGNVQTIIAGIFSASVTSAGSGSIIKNLVTGLTNSSTTATSYLLGIVCDYGNWNLYNNVVLIDNGPNANSLIIRGIESYNGGAATTYNVHHNTSKVYGSVTAGASSTMAYYGNTNTGTENVKNNIFQNLRSGGTGIHYAENTGTSGTYNTDFNYLEATDPAKIAKRGITDYDFAGWKVATGAAGDLNGTTAIDANGYAPAGFVGANAGFDLFTPGTVTDDRMDNPRDAAPWMGAYEGPLVMNTISTDPIAPTTLCRGGSITVTYTITGTYNAGNVFTAELSDATGSFATPTVIGSVASTTNTPIAAIIPLGAAPGTLYRIRVVSSNPVVTGTDNGTNLTIPPDGGIGTWNWVGGISTNWFDRCNWDKKSLPDLSSDVSIPGGAPNNPSIAGAAANCKTITIDSGSGAVVNLNSSGGGILNIAQ